METQQVPVFTLIEMSRKLGDEYGELVTTRKVRYLLDQYPALAPLPFSIASRRVFSPAVYKRLRELFAERAEKEQLAETK